jgi:hypothetical protein
MLKIIRKIFNKENTMNLSKRREDKELFFGVQSSKKIHKRTVMIVQVHHYFFEYQQKKIY